MGAEEKAAARAAEGLVARMVEQAGVRESETLVQKITRIGTAKVARAEQYAADAMRARGLTGAPTDLLRAQEEAQARRLTPRQRLRVADAHAAAARNEARISPKVRTAAREAGMETAGERFRLKGLDSLERKIGGRIPADVAGDAADPLVAAELSEVNDMVRYTMVAPEEAYAASTDRAVAALKAQGFEPVPPPKNNWPNATGYRGVNTTWQDPSSGQLFEMQFHTPESLAAKEVTHPIYDFGRVAEPGRAAELQAMQNEVFDLVPIPGGTTTEGARAWPLGGGTS